MPRPRYRQDPLPLGDCAPPPTLYGPEQPLPAGLERIEQGQLGVMPLGPLFEGAELLGRSKQAQCWMGL